MATTHDPGGPSVDDAHWQEIKSRLQKRWGQIEDNDLKMPMSMAELSDLVQKKTGEAKTQVEGFLSEVLGGLRDRAESLRTSISPQIQSLQDAAAGHYEDATAGLRDGYASVESQVRAKPGQTLAIAFGVGIVAGLLLGGGSRRA